MAAKFLKLNGDKTELVLIKIPNRLAAFREFELSIANINEKPSPCARKMAVNFDSSLSFKSFC